MASGCESRAKADTPTRRPLLMAAMMFLWLGSSTLPAPAHDIFATHHDILIDMKTTYRYPEEFDRIVVRLDIPCKHQAGVIDLKSKGENEEGPA